MWYFIQNRESLSLQSYLDGKADVPLNNIVFMDPNTLNYSAVPDPLGLLENCPVINSLASTGNLLFMLCKNSHTIEIYSWDSQNDVKLIYTDLKSNLTHNLQTDSHGNLFILSYNEDDNVGKSLLAFFNASNGYQGNFHIQQLCFLAMH